MAEYASPVDSIMEVELVELAGIKPKAREDRSKFLDRLVRKIDDMGDNGWGAMSEDQQAWINAGIEAIEGDKPVVEFANGEKKNKDKKAKGKKVKSNSEDPETNEDASGQDEYEATKELADEASGKSTKSKGKKAKGKKAGPAQPDKKKHGGGPRKTKPEMRAKRGKDQFGLLNESKSSIAATMFVKGSTMAKVREETGINHYNLLNRLTDEGHEIERKAGVITLVPKK